MAKGVKIQPEQVVFLQLFAPGLLINDLTPRFNRRFNTDFSSRTIRAACSRRGIAYLTVGSGKFEKGIVPWNTGKHGVRYSPATEFKTGRLPANTDDLGAIKRCSEGYLYKKVDNLAKGGKKQNWRLVHHLVWEQAHGKIPAGHVLVFKDCNKENCSVGNLDCISRAKLAIYNLFLKEIRLFDCYESKSLLADLILAGNKK